jgi:hypothetical protein
VATPWKALPHVFKTKNNHWLMLFHDLLVSAHACSSLQKQEDIKTKCCFSEEKDEIF